MNILTIELEYQRTFHIVPHIWVNLGKSFGKEELEAEKERKLERLQE